MRDYAFAGLERIRTPALLIYADAVDANLATTLGLLGTPDRWRPHLKTAKLGWSMRRLRAAGVAQAKCATTLELEAACAAGFDDVLLAYPAVGPTVETTLRIAEANPQVRVSALVEDAGMLAAWQGGRVGLFIDVNPGMDRTGLAPVPGPVLALAQAIDRAGLTSRGLHFYDGQASGPAVAAGCDVLLGIALALREAGLPPEEIVTAGTPAFPAALEYPKLRDAGFLHRLSPGTLLYCDARSLGELPPGYQAAALVLARVVSHPLPARVTCDAGHKTVSADAGVPTCEVIGHPDWTGRTPSEEHLPIDLPAGSPLPPRGEPLWLLPRHVCPTVNNFDHAVIVQEGAVAGIERVTARGRHAPELRAASLATA